MARAVPRRTIFLILVVVYITRLGFGTNVWLLVSRMVLLSKSCDLICLQYPQGNSHFWKVSCDVTSCETGMCRDHHEVLVLVRSVLTIADPAV